MLTVFHLRHWQGMALTQHYSTVIYYLLVWMNRHLAMSELKENCIQVLRKNLLKPSQNCSSSLPPTAPRKKCIVWKVFQKGILYKTWKISVSIQWVSPTSIPYLRLLEPCRRHLSPRAHLVWRDHPTLITRPRLGLASPTHHTVENSSTGCLKATGEGHDLHGVAGLQENFPLLKIHSSSVHFLRFRLVINLCISGRCHRC